MPYSPSFSRYLADIAASYQPPYQPQESPPNMSPENPPPPGPPAVDYSTADTGAVARAEADPNGAIPAQGGGGLMSFLNKPYNAPLSVDKWAAPVTQEHHASYEPKPVYDDEGKITEEGKKELEKGGHVKANEPPAQPMIGPPPPPVDDGFTKHGKETPRAGGAVAGGGGAGGAGGSAAMSMSSTEPGTLAGGGNWEGPELTARAALSSIGTANADIAGAEGEAAQRREEAANKAAAESARIQHEYDRVSQEHFNKLDQLNKEVAEGKIDPEHWARTRTTGQKVLYMLGAALGGFAAGFRPGTPNYAMEMIKQEVDNDIDAQRANLENKRHAAEGEKGILGEIYNRTHNMQQSVLLAKDLAYDHIGNQLQELTAASHSSIASANANLAGAEWEKWKEMQKEHTAEFVASETDRRMAIMARASRGGGGGGGGANNKDVQKLAHEMATSHIPEMESAINQVQRDLKNGNGAGLGRIKTAILNHLKMGEGFLSREGKQTRQDLKAAQAEGARFVAGRYGGPSAKAMADMLDSGDPEQVQAALHYFNGRIGAIKQGIYAGHDPSTIGVYEDRVRSDAGGGGGEEDEPDLMPADEGH